MTFFGGEGDISPKSFYHSCLHIKIQEQYTLSNIITFDYTGNKFLQFGLEWNKYNKSLKHATLNHAVHYATLQNNELTIFLSGKLIN